MTKSEALQRNWRKKHTNENEITSTENKMNKSARWNWVKNREQLDTRKSLTLANVTVSLLTLFLIHSVLFVASILFYVVDYWLVFLECMLPALSPSLFVHHIWRQRTYIHNICGCVCCRAFRLSFSLIMFRFVWWSYRGFLIAVSVYST